MIEEAITIVPWIGTALCIPLFFIVIFCGDMIKLKLGATLKKKKGAKLILTITKDKNVKFGIETLNKESKLQREKEAIEWDSTRQYYTPQLGIQAAFEVPGLKSIYDPLSEKELDLADGEVVDRMVKRAELMRDLNGNWLETKEQKLLVAVLVVCLITAGLTFATSAQIGEFIEWTRPALMGIKDAIATIPRSL